MEAIEKLAVSVGFVERHRQTASDGSEYIMWNYPDGSLCGTTRNIEALFGSLDVQERLIWSKMALDHNNIALEWSSSSIPACWVCRIYHIHNIVVKTYGQVLSKVALQAALRLYGCE